MNGGQVAAVVTGSLLMAMPLGVVYGERIGWWFYRVTTAPRGGMAYAHFDGTPCRHIWLCVRGAKPSPAQRAEREILGRPRDQLDGMG